MKTTTQILETESFQCMPDGFDVLINKKWVSEEEIMKAINTTKNSQIQLPYKIDLFKNFLKELFGDE